MGSTQNLYLTSIFSEILRVVDSLQLTASKKVATPVDWKVTKKITYCTFELVN